MNHYVLKQGVEGLVLGALAVRSPYDVAPSLSMLIASLARYSTEHEIRDKIMTTLDSFSGSGLVTLTSSLDRPAECRVALARRARSASDFCLLAEDFIVGGVMFHYAPLVQVSLLRRAAYRLWLEREVDSAIYRAAQLVRRQGGLACRDRTSDVDQWYFALPRDSALLV